MQRRDPAQGGILLRWIDRIRAAFAGCVLDVTTDDWMRCAELHTPDPRPLRDSLIAACALQNNLIVVTRNISDFVAMLISLLNPWDC